MRNEARRPIHYQRQARQGHLIFFSAFIDFFSLVFCLGSFLCLLCFIHTLFETGTLQINALYLSLFLIINGTSPLVVDWIVRRILILPLVPGLSGSFSPWVGPRSVLCLATWPELPFKDTLNHNNKLAVLCMYDQTRSLRLSCQSTKVHYVTKCTLTAPAQPHSETVHFGFFSPALCLHIPFSKGGEKRGCRVGCHLQV